MTQAPQNNESRRRVVGAEQDHATVAAIVRELMDQLPWTKSRELVRTGRVTVDGVQCFDPATRVASGAVIEINPTAKRRRAPTLEPERLVFVDAEIVVVEKPAGLISVAHDEQEQRDSLIERTRIALLERERDEEDKAGSDRLGVVQRLDEDTTGLIVFARTRRARKHLDAQFRAHTVERRYVALVYGRAEAAVHDSYLVPDRGDGRRGSWHGPNRPPAAKRSITKVRIEQRLQAPKGQELTLISCQLETGRQHQLRIHLAEAGNPLVGERVYGRPREIDPFGALRPMLHAASLGFRHPAHDRPVRFESPLPVDFRALLDTLRRV
ncbi:MAG TPA: RluA family pseudouridine synthase [Enhygromyxa sp.]|nr:RluA family pseudouridine synthase [Enhygromyxa sp.]